MMMMMMNKKQYMVIMNGLTKGIFKTVYQMFYLQQVVQI